MIYYHFEAGLLRSKAEPLPERKAAEVISQAIATIATIAGEGSQITLASVGRTSATRATRSSSSAGWAPATSGGSRPPTRHVQALYDIPRLLSLSRVSQLKLDKLITRR